MQATVAPQIPAQRADEARRFPRFEVELEISVVCDSNFYTGFTENISEGGLFVATHQLRAMGSKVELRFTLPDGRGAIDAVAEVRWVREYSETSQAPPGMGLRFLDLSDENAARVQAFLGARAPIFFDE